MQFIGYNWNQSKVLAVFATIICVNVSIWFSYANLHNFFFVFVSNNNTNADQVQMSYSCVGFNRNDLVNYYYVIKIHEDFPVVNHFKRDNISSTFSIYYFR